MLFFLGGGSRLSHGTQRIRRQHCRQQRDPLARPVQPGCRCGEAAPRPLSPRKLDMPWDGSINGCCNHPHHPLGCVCLSRGHDVLSTLTPAVTGARIFLFSSSFPPSHRERRAHNAPSLPLPPFRDSGAAKRGSWLQTLLFCCHIYASRRSGYHIAQLGRGRGCCAVGRIRRQSLARADICIPRISCNRN